MGRPRTKPRPVVRVKTVAVLFDGARPRDELDRAAGLLRWLVSRHPGSPDTLAAEWAAAVLGWAAGRDRNNPVPSFLAHLETLWVECGSPPVPPDPEAGKPAFRGRGRPA